MSDHEFRLLKTRGTFLQECSSKWVRRATSADPARRFKSCEAKRFVRQFGPVDIELSKVHEAEVHVFSDSVLWVGNQAMNMPEIKFNIRWMSTSCNTRNPQGELMENTFNSCWTFGSTTNEIVLRIDEWIRLCKGEDGEQSTPEPHAHRVILVWMMNEIQISSQDRKEVMRISSRRGKKCSLLRKVQARMLRVHWSRFRRKMEIWRVPRQHKPKVDELAKQVRMCILHKNIQSWKDATNSEK